MNGADRVWIDRMVNREFGEFKNSFTNQHEIYVDLQASQ